MNISLLLAWNHLWIGAHLDYYTLYIHPIPFLGIRIDFTHPIFGLRIGL